MLMSTYRRSSFSDEFLLEDEVINDFRFAHGQQLFKHSLNGTHQGCEILQENTTNTSNIWAWVNMSDGSRRCLKLWQDVTLVPKDFVQAASGFARKGEKRIIEPTTGTVHDCWAWCRADNVCYYEDVESRAPVSYVPLNSTSTGASIVEMYSNFNPSVDKGRVELPVECPDRHAPPLYVDNTDEELGQSCRQFMDRTVGHLMMSHHPSSSLFHAVFV